MTHVLVVDDSPTFRRLVCPMLREAGYRVSEAVNGEDALVALEASQERLVVLLDVVMPKLGGIGVLNTVDASEDLAQRHVFILVTSSPEVVPPHLTADMLRRLRVPLLTKPFASEQLLDLVEQAAGRLQTV